MTADHLVGPPVAGDEAATLLGSLERQRATFAWKVGGLDARGLATRLEPSTMTLGGLVKHVAFVEELRFTTMLRGRAPAPTWDAVSRDGDGGWPWRSAADDSPAVLYELWRETVVRSRASVDRALAETGLDGRVAYLHDGSDESEHPSLRRLLTDTIEEYARHVGHADLLRESVDGLVGEDPPRLVYPYPPLTFVT